MEHPGVGDGIDLPDGVELTTDHIFHQSIKLTQPKQGYRYGTDAVLLAASMSAQKGRLLDMGAGVGAVSLGAAWRCPKLQITAVEKEPLLAQLLTFNIEQNDMSDRVRALQADIARLPPVLKGSFDHVVANPPFHQSGDVRSANKRRALAHSGDGLSLSQWVQFGLAALKPKGRLSFIVRADRGDEVIAALRQGSAGEIVQFPVWSYHGSPAVRLIITARKQVQGVSALLSGIVLHHANGTLSEAANKVMSGEALEISHPKIPQPK